MSQLPRAQLGGSIQTPGLAVLPPVDAGVAQSQQIFAAFGQAGSAIAQAGQAAAVKTAQNKETNAAFAGQAALDMANQLPEFKSMADAGELDFLFADLQEGETINGRVQDFLGTRLDEQEAPEAYREQALKFAPGLTRALVARQGAIIGQARDDTTSTMLAGAGTVPISETSAALAAIRPDLSDQQIKEMVTSAAIRSAMISDAPSAAISRIAAEAPVSMRVDVEIARQKAAAIEDAIALDAIKADTAKAVDAIGSRQNSTASFVEAGKQLAAERAKADPNEAKIAALEAEEFKYRGRARNDVSDAFKARMDALVRDPKISPEQIVPAMRQFWTDLGVPAELIKDGEVQDLINGAVLNTADFLLKGDDPDIATAQSLFSAFASPTDDDRGALQGKIDAAKRAQSDGRTKEMTREQTSRAVSMAVAQFEGGAALDSLNRVRSDSGLPPLGVFGGRLDLMFAEDFVVLDDNGTEVARVPKEQMRRMAFEQLKARGNNALLAGMVPGINEMSPVAQQEQIGLLMADPVRSVAFVEAAKERGLALIKQTGYVDPQVAAIVNNSGINQIGAAEEITDKHVEAFNLYLRLSDLGMHRDFANDSVRGRFEDALGELRFGEASGPRDAIAASLREPVTGFTRALGNSNDVRAVVADAGFAEFQRTLFNLGSRKIAAAKSFVTFGLVGRRDPDTLDPIAIQVVVEATNKGMERGLTREQAVAAAKDRLARDFVTVNGFATDAHGLPFPPAVLPAVGEALIDEHFAKYDDARRADDPSLRDKIRVVYDGSRRVLLAASEFDNIPPTEIKRKDAADVADGLGTINANEDEFARLRENFAEQQRIAAGKTTLTEKVKLIIAGVEVEHFVNDGKEDSALRRVILDSVDPFLTGDSTFPPVVPAKPVRREPAEDPLSPVAEGILRRARAKAEAPVRAKEADDAAAVEVAKIIKSAKADPAQMQRLRSQAQLLSVQKGTGANVELKRLMEEAGIK